MEKALYDLLEESKAAVVSASSETELFDVKVRYLGKKGKLTEVLKEVGKLPAEEKPKIGKVVNEVKVALQSALDEKLETIKSASLKKELEEGAIDVTLPGRSHVLGSQHPVSRVKQRVIEIFTQMGFKVAEGPEIEDDYHNFTALNIPENHPARAMQDTFYLPGGLLLRTHTSPVQIREMKKSGAPTRLIALGRVYRKDSDQTHTPMFHQLEGLVVDRQCTFANLKYVLQDFLSVFFGREMKLRFRPSYFPFTEPSAEVDIFNERSDSWLEVLGCGMVHPNVLENVGIDSTEFSGYAFGVGLDRLAMLLYGIPDLRMLFENDVRFLRQF